MSRTDYVLTTDGFSNLPPDCKLTWRGPDSPKGYETEEEARLAATRIRCELAGRYGKAFGINLRVVKREH